MTFEEWWENYEFRLHAFGITDLAKVKTVIENAWWTGCLHGQELIEKEFKNDEIRDVGATRCNMPNVLNDIHRQHFSRQAAG